MRISEASSSGRRAQRAARVDLDLKAERRAPAEARRALERFDRLEPETLDNALLVITELVSNSVRHAGLRPHDRIHVEIEERPDAVRLVVTNPGSGFDLPAEPPAADRSQGWGLFLVNRLASEWGVSRRGKTRVWCELPRAATA